MTTVKAVMVRVSDPDPAVRRAAASELGKRRSPAAREALMGCLDHRDPEVRRVAGLALGQFADLALAPLLIRSARLEKEPRAQLALWRSAARVYRQRGRLEDIPRLAGYMAESSFPDDAMGDVCSAALYVLAAHAEQLPSSLIGLLQAPAVLAFPLIQTALQKAIATNASQKLARALAPAYLDLLEEGGFEAYQPAFIEALGNMREVRAIGSLLKRFEAAPSLQDKVLGALSLIGVENLDPVMAAAVRLHEEIYFRTPSEEEFVTFFFESAQRLAAMGEAAVPVLMRLLDHPNGAMRQNARFALEALREPGALLSMLRIAGNRRDLAKTRLAWELVSRHHPDRSVKALAVDQLLADQD
ncbi:MAG: HEAT repeat domain-containing protein [Elusimicrobia bacterium]|nr:HEAT repeat domain-containing protein [Elusimicrobiota bacterium]